MRAHGPFSDTYRATGQSKFSLDKDLVSLPTWASRTLQNIQLLCGKFRGVFTEKEQMCRSNMAVSHIVILFCATAGKNGEDLGVDEEQIVIFVYLLFDVTNNKVRDFSGVC